MTPLLPSLMLLAVGDLHADVEGGAAVTQLVGELPVGFNGQSVLSYDSAIEPRLQLQLADDRFRGALVYQPRFLIRYQDRESGFEPLEANGRPVLILHSLTAQTEHELAPRWSLANEVVATFGDVDFALFARDGLAGAGGTATADIDVLQSTSVSAMSTLTAPLVGRDDLRTSATFNVTIPDNIPGEAFLMTGMDVNTSLDRPGDELCFAEADTRDFAPAPLAKTCQMGLASALVTDLSALDRLEVQGAYTALDVDPGPYLHVLRADVLWRRTLTRSLAVRAGGGASIAFNPDPLRKEDALGLSELGELTLDDQGRLVDGMGNEFFVSEEDSVTIFPILNLGVSWQVVSQRSFSLMADLQLGTDASIDPAIQLYLLQASATAALTAVIRQDFSVGWSVSAFALGVDRGRPPQVSDGAGGSFEQPDLSAFGTDLNISWEVDSHVTFLATGRYGFRARHVTRLGVDRIPAAQVGVFPANPNQSQREVAVSLGLRFTYGTNRNLGGGDGGASAAPAAADGGEEGAQPAEESPTDTPPPPAAPEDGASPGGRRPQP